MAIRFHIRQSWDGKKWYPIPGTEQPERGDITLAFDVDPSRSAAVEFLLSHITSVAMFGGLSSVYSRPWIGWALILWGLVVLAFFGYSANFLYFHHEEYPIRSFILNAAWIVGVPLYFFSEHFLFYYFGNPLQYDQFKRVQDLAAKIWIGAIAVLAAILAVKLH